MSLKKLRDALYGTALPPEAEAAIALAEQSQREEASYTQYLESRLESALGENKNGNEGHTSMLRKEWEQSKGQSQSQHGQRLEEIEEKILVFLSGRPHGAAIFADHVASQCGVGTQVAMHHLEELNKRVLVLVGHSMIEPPRWSLGSEGRSYLVTHDLIS